MNLKMQNKQELFLSIVLILIGFLLMQFPTPQKNINSNLYITTISGNSVSHQRIVEYIDPTYDQKYPKKN